MLKKKKKELRNKDVLYVSTAKTKHGQNNMVIN
jgi:hypothetical protein